MGICWYCHWGWSEKVCEIYETASKELGYTQPLDEGPGDCVWADENFDDESIKQCIERCDSDAQNYSAREIGIVRRSLVDLLQIPEEIRDCEPVEYDEENPENFPPTVKVRRINHASL